MKVILSDAKKMLVSEDHGLSMTSPIYEKEAANLRNRLSNFSYDKLKQIYKCSDRTLEPIWEQILLEKHGVKPELSPALLSYEGIAYRYLAANVFTDEQWAWADDHLRVLSGIYGVLRPRDAISPYRLEMKSKPDLDLYQYWSDKAAKTMKDEVIINLASLEYSKMITPYCPVINVRFYQENEAGRRKETAVYAKMARGAMARFLAEQNAQSPEVMKEFNLMDYRYDDKASSTNNYVFVRKEPVHG